MPTPTTAPESAPTLWEDSRRLFGASSWLNAPGVVLDALIDPLRGDEEIEAWQERVRSIAAEVGWDVATTARRHGCAKESRASLAFTAPVDLLLAATLVNEWAWRGAALPDHRVSPAADDPETETLPAERAEALSRLRDIISEQSNPELIALTDRAERAAVPWMACDEYVNVGFGVHGRTWPIRSIPSPDEVDWKELGEIPVALVTGSNGKTTTVRVVAAMLARAGHLVGHSCSDGVFIGGEQVERGDWSGPAGARRVLRDPRVTAAVLETARGGILRRGVSVPRATAAIVTNVAEDHFGDYGINSLVDLAAAKLLIARALGRDGTLVLNADDPTLRAASNGHPGRVVWFSASEACALTPPPEQMPLTLGGRVLHNVANAIGAAHVAQALGVSPECIRETLLTFGERNSDNPGRLERFDVGGVRVWVDYAHNPHGLSALLSAAVAERGDGRLGLLLGQAGDRDDEAIRDLARVAQAALPDRIVLTDIEEYLRGRSPGEVPDLLEGELRSKGISALQMTRADDETEGVRELLEWAEVGDLLVLPVHALDARDSTLALIREWH